MALFSGSRYSLGENGKKITATNVIRSSGIAVTYLHDRKVYRLSDLLSPSFLHEVISGELIDLVAFLKSGDSTKWWLIADINEMFYVDDEMDIGRNLQIPNIEDFRSV